MLPSPALVLPVPHRTHLSRLVSQTGFALLLVWLCWLGASLSQQPLPKAIPHQADYLNGRLTNVHFMPFMGLDFHANYAAVRTWRQGGDPYTHVTGDPANHNYVYPPLTLLAFSWVNLFSPTLDLRAIGPGGAMVSFTTSVPAIITWLLISIAIFVVAALHSSFTRRELGLPHIPVPFVLAATLASYPVLFELERGNCNVLPLLALLVLVAALGWPRRLRGDLVAGLCVALATGIKPYALILLLGLLALRRFRAAAFAVAWLALQALVLLPDLRRFLTVALIENQTSLPIYLDFSHSVIAHWSLLWRDLGWPQLAQLPAQPIMGGLLLLAMIYVSWQVHRRAVGLALAWPFLLWLAGTATMIFPVANDYNLLFIPLAALAAWNAADSWRIQLCVAAILPWWQPFHFGLTDLAWLLLKSASVVLLGALILRRLDDAPLVPPAEPAPEPVATSDHESAVPAPA